MIIRTRVALAAPILFLGVQPSPASDDPRARPAATTDVDVQPRPLAWIRPGTVIGDEPPPGWSHLVLLAKPRLGVGDVDAVPRTAMKYTTMFLFTLLANVRATATDDGPRHSLDKVAMGSVLEIDGRKVVANSRQTFGKDLGFIGRRVFQENESLLASEVRQVARTRTMMVFDINLTFLYRQRHSRMVLRHVVVVSPADGKLTTLVWLMGSDGKGGYALAEPKLRLLPAGMNEDRILSVDARKFTLGIPAADAFALVRVPPGSPVRFTAGLAAAAVTRRFDPESARRLESELQASYAPLVAQMAATGSR